MYNFSPSKKKSNLKDIHIVTFLSQCLHKSIFQDCSWPSQVYMGWGSPPQRVWPDLGFNHLHPS